MLAAALEIRRPRSSRRFAGSSRALAAGDADAGGGDALRGSARYGVHRLVLSFGVWALAGVSLAVGDPGLGLLIGAAFGIGRAIPDSLARTRRPGGPFGVRVTQGRCASGQASISGLGVGMRPALLVAALALIVLLGDAGARGSSAPQAADPSATIDALVYQRLGGQGVLRRGAQVGLSGSNPLIEGRFVAVLSGGRVELLDRGSWLRSRRWKPAVGGFDRGLRGVARLQGAAGKRQRTDVPPAHPGSPSAQGRCLPSPPSAAQPGQPAQPRRQQPRIRDRDAVRKQVVGSSGLIRIVHSSVGRLLLLSPAVTGRTFTCVRTDARRSLMIRGKAACTRQSPVHGAPPDGDPIWVPP